MQCPYFLMLKRQWQDHSILALVRQQQLLAL